MFLLKKILSLINFKNQIDIKIAKKLIIDIRVIQQRYIWKNKIQRKLFLTT